MTSTAEDITSNLRALLKIHSKAIDVINAAKNKNNKEISNQTGLHVTLVSRILTRAKNFEYVEKKEGKWVKAKQIKGYDLQRMVKSEEPPKFSDTKRKAIKNKVREISKNYESEFLTEANNNLRAYIDIYVIENIFRKIIFDSFGRDKNWWKIEFVPKEVLDHADNVRIAESKHPWIKKRGDHPIYYIGLEELRKIISKNWAKHFKWIGEQQNFLTWVDELIPIRNMVAHNVRLQKEEIDMTGIKSKWLINLINNKKIETTNKIQAN